MNWIERWRSISARIAGLMEAANFLIQAMQVNSSDTYSTAKYLLRELTEIMDELRSLHTSDAGLMPPLAAKALEDHIAKQPNPNVISGHAAVYLQVLTHLFAFRSRFEYLIRDSEIEGRNATELSFEHLKRIIAVDDRTRSAWQDAWNTNEVACEKLGSVHLLSHGIWAFKVQAGGAITDLVYSEPVQSTVVSRTSRAIVLTEWKLVRNLAEADVLANAARIQANAYAGGALGHLELNRTRYVVLVGEKQQEAPADVASGEITYRHIWLAVKPEVPSVQARATAKKAKASS